MILFARRICLLLILALLAVALSAGPIEDWQTLETGVRDGTLPRAEAKEKLAALVPALSGFSGGGGSTEVKWAFPVKGYGISALNRRDYQPKSAYAGFNKAYDFFDGNRHGGHPAYDIFIHDKNQDSIDDRTGAPADAVAMVDAVVLSVNTGWTPASRLRGGNYVWLYAPEPRLFLYYAHLASIAVKPGDHVVRGSTVGTVGRTGTNASVKRSPTHVHLMVLRYDGNTLVPVDYLKFLKGKK